MIKYLLTIILSLSTLLSDTINVPEDFPTIQQAINASSDGDTVLVLDGVYYENLNMNSKQITLSSQHYINGIDSHIYNTVIDGDSLGHVIIIDNYTDAIINGLTIQNGFTDSLTYGAGILIDNFSSPTISNCIIKDNHARRSGSGISVNDGSSPYITHCKFINNYTPRGGAGIYCKQSTVPVQPEIRNCLFDTNFAGTGGGGALRGKSIASPSIYNSYFINNSADFGGGIHHPFGGNPVVISSSSFCGNEPDDFSSSSNLIIEGDLFFTDDCDSLRNLFVFESDHDSGDHDGCEGVLDECGVCNGDSSTCASFSNWIEYPGHAISGNGTGADRLYLSETDATGVADFRQICESMCLNGIGDGDNGTCGAIVINYFDIDNHLNPNYCVFKLPTSVPYENPAKDSYVYEELQYFIGDVNLDSLINVLDGVIIVNIVLNNEYNELADLNDDSIINVLDIVQLVNIILN